MSKQRPAGGSGTTPHESRAERLARQLRENLRRRKAQKRARAGGAGETDARPPGGRGPSPDDE